MHDEDSIAIATEKPNIKLLTTEFRRAGASGDFFARLYDAEATRLARWDGQTSDGKKHDEEMEDGEEAFPWDGSSDVRCFQSDSVCNENAAVQTTAFWRAELRVSPVGPEDSTDSTVATTFIDWLRYARLANELCDETELSAQCQQEAGWFMLHTTWEREVSKKLRVVSMPELHKVAAQFQQQLESGQIDMASATPEQQQVMQAILVYPSLIANPETEEQAIAVTQYMHRLYVEQQMPKGIESDDISELSTKRARAAVRELREEGETKLPFPYLCKNQPCIKTLRPWADVVIPGYAADVDSTPYVFLPMYFTEADLKAKIISEGWDSVWVDGVVKTKGQKSHWLRGNSNTDGISYTTTIDEDEDQIEVVCAYVKQIDEDGVTSINYVYFSPNYQGETDGGHDYGKGGLLDYPNARFPLRLCRREMRDRPIITTRGVPEILSTSQREEKVQRDSIVDLTSITTLPPVNVPKGALGQKFIFAPGVQNMTTPGRAPEFMQTPTQGVIPAEKYLMLLDQKKDRYFGLFSETNPPALSQLLMEGPVRRYLTTWALALYDAYQLACKFAPDLIERITQERPPAIDDIHTGEHDLTLHFDVGMLNPEIAAQKMEAYSKLLTEDFGGIIDRNAYVRIKARLIDHRLYKELVMSQAPASEQMQTDVRNELTSMFAGNPPMIKDASNDPTAPARLQYAQQTIASNPKMLQALDPQLIPEILGPQLAMQVQMQMQAQQQQGGTMTATNQPDPLFTSYVEAYFQNLQQGADQQQNKMTGRTGVAQGAGQ